MTRGLSVLLVGTVPTDVIEALRAKGHTVTALGDGAEYDLVLGPACHRMVPELATYLPAALTAARRRTKKETR
jgi:hypothetical protein